MAWESPRFYFFSIMHWSDQPRSGTTISGYLSLRSFPLVSLTAFAAGSLMAHETLGFT